MSSARTFTSIMLTFAIVFALGAAGTLADSRAFAPLYAVILVVLATYCAIASWCCPRLRGWR